LFREDLEFVKAIGSPQSQRLLAQGVEQELDSLGKEVEQPTDRTAQRVALCLDYGEIVGAGSLEVALISAVGAKSAGALRGWLTIIEQERARLGGDFPNRFVVRCIDIVPSLSADTQRQELLLDAVINVLPGLAADEKRSALHKYFSLLKDPELKTRNVAASKLSGIRDSSSDTQDLRLAIANVIKYLRDEIRTGELPAYRAVFDALLTQPELLGEYQYRDLADMAKGLMSENDDSLRELGLHVVGQMPVIPNDDQAAVIHLLVGIAGSSPDLRQRASDRLTRFSLDKVVNGARQELEGWLRSGA
jgi:hypothetical protein